MFARCSVRGLLLLCLGSSLVGCSNPSGLDSIQVTPASQSLTVGQTAQLTAIGTFGNASHPSTQNITSAVTWSFHTPSVATVSCYRAGNGCSCGHDNHHGQRDGFNGDPVNSSAILTVTGQPEADGGSGGSILSLTIIPSGISVGNLQDTGQFLAIGTFSTAAIRQRSDELGDLAFFRSEQIPGQPTNSVRDSGRHRQELSLPMAIWQRRRHYHRGSNRNQ